MRLLITIIVVSVSASALAGALAPLAARLALDGGELGKGQIAFAERDCRAFWFADAKKGGRLASTHLRLTGTINGQLAELELVLPIRSKGAVELGPNDRNGMTRYARLFVYGASQEGDVSAKLGNVRVELTRYDAVGGRIAGTAKGTLFGAGDAIHVELTFDIPRAADVADW